jgi:hypothetical protein
VDELALIRDTIIRYAPMLIAPLSIPNSSRRPIATEIADYSKRSFEHGAKAAEKLIGAKSLDKVIEVQSEYARTAYESYVSEISKLGELYGDLAREAFKPYQSFVARVTPTSNRI